MGRIVDLKSYRRRTAVVYFSRRELNLLLSLFSRRVLAREWLDYSIDNHEGFAAFCVYRHAHDAPLYKILRLAPGSHPHGDYVVFRGAARVRQANTLSTVLTGFAPPLRAVRS
jgi:hypothetical protein